MNGAVIHTIGNDPSHKLRIRGTSGLHAQLWLDAVCGVEQDAALHALENSGQQFGKQGVAARCRCICLGASLVALAEERMGTCGPIAVGIVWRLFTSTCLSPQQFAVLPEVFWFTPSGVWHALWTWGATIRTISHYRERNATSTSKIVMTINFHNAFNSLDKNALVHGLLA